MIRLDINVLTSSKKKEIGKLVKHTVPLITYKINEIIDLILDLCSVLADKSA